VETAIEREREREREREFLDESIQEVQRGQGRRGGGFGWELEVGDRGSMEMESPRSPEAEIGHRVEDLWEVAEPQLSPSEKLNSCFEDIPVASFPTAHPSQGMYAILLRQFRLRSVPCS
jgi:hypothetical protein